MIIEFKFYEIFQVVPYLPAANDGTLSFNQKLNLIKKIINKNI